MRSPVATAAAAALLAAAAPALAADGGWVVEPLDREAVAAVWSHIDHKDCPGAVKALNDGIARRHPSVLLLGGAMFESGVCLKPSWSKAADFYQRAHAAGHPKAAAKLASGYMSAAAGPDRAAALWWALQGGQPLPDECAQVKPLSDQPDRFVAALQAWPAGRLDGCSYVSAVVGAMYGDTEFSNRAAAHGLRGSILARFLPAQERIDLQVEELDFIQVHGVKSGDDGRDRDSQVVKREFERDIRASADRALKRHARPAGVDAAWQVDMRFGFGYVLR